MNFSTPPKLNLDLNGLAKKLIFIPFLRESVEFKHRMIFLSKLAPVVFKDQFMYFINSCSTG